MSCGNSTIAEERGAAKALKKYRGVRRRKWGKWVSEIRVPRTQQRLWLGSYSAPEAAAVAHDVASYCLHGPTSLPTLNFPLTLPASVSANMSPKSIQRAASDAGMAVDAQMTANKCSLNDDEEQLILINQSSALRGAETVFWDKMAYSSDSWDGTEHKQEEALSISIDDYL